MMLIALCLLFGACSTAQYRAFMDGYKEGRSMGLGRVGYHAAGGTDEETSKSTQYTSDHQKEKNACMYDAASKGIDYSHCPF